MDRSNSFKDSFWGGDFVSSAGLDALKKRAREGRLTCKAYAEYLQKRAKSEEGYTKLLFTAATFSTRLTETGTLRSAIDSMREETDRLADVHTELCNQFSQAYKRLNEFMTRQKAESKQREEAVDKALKTKVNLFKACTDAKRQYEVKCAEAENAELTFNRAKPIQQTYATKDWDKLVTNVKKTKTEAEKAHTCYEDYVRKLDAARKEWEHEMEEFSKMCEDHDVQRIKLLQNEMWIGCNLTSTGAVKLDEQSEAVRKKLESVNVAGDIRSFVETCGTGSDRPAPIRFEAFKSQIVEANGAAQLGSTLHRSSGDSSVRQPPVQIINKTFNL